MAWASARCGLGQAPYGLGKRPMRPRQAHCQQLGMRPVTLRRISQHPPVTSKLGLSSRLALPAHFHRQPGFLMCGLLNDKKKKKKIVRCHGSAPQSWPRWAHSGSNTPQSSVTVERGIKFGIDQNRDAATNCWRLAPVTHAGRAASSPEIFRPFLAVCLTVFPFKFQPRTFTIGFYGKKSFISELMILECSFPLTHLSRRNGWSSWSSKMTRLSVGSNLGIFLEDERLVDGWKRRQLVIRRRCFYLTRSNGDKKKKKKKKRKRTFR